MGQQSLVPTFWSIPSAMLTGVAAAGGLAMINAVGNTWAASSGLTCSG